MDSAIFERPVNTIAEMVFEDVNSQSDFDELKDEFCIMYQEMQDMNEELEALRKALYCAETRLAEKDDASVKMVDQMEELHENLAELDVRFERSETINKQLREEKEEIKQEFETQLTDVQTTLTKSQAEAKEAKEALSKLSEEFQKYQNETNNKIQNLQNTYKNSIDNVLNPLSSYLEKNKGSKIPLKKTKCYRLLKSTESNLKNTVTETENNNK